MDGLHAKQVKPGHRPADIHERVHGADVVKVDRLDRRPVDPGLSGGQSREDARRVRLDATG